MSYDDLYDHNEFIEGDAGASNLNFREASTIRPGSLVMMKGFPCKVKDFTTARPGKHGSAKVILKGKDIFTNSEYEETFCTGDMIPCPVVKKTEYTCIDVNEDGYLMLMTKDGEMKEDLKIDTYDHLKGLEKKIKAIIDAGKKECLVQVQAWGEKEQAVDCREGNDQ